MKKIIILLVALILLSSFISTPVFSEKLSQDKNLKYQLLEKDGFWNTWHSEPADIFGEVGHYTDIAINVDNVVFISHYDFERENLKCARFENGRWINTAVDSEGDVGRCTSLALDSLGNPHISYYDETNQCLKHAYHNGDEWNIEIVDSSGNVGLDTSIIIDSNDVIHITYHDQSNGDLKYAKSSDNGWEIQIVDSMGHTGEITCITLDNNENPHISYTSRDGFSLYYAYLVDDEWVIEIVDDVSKVFGSTCITFDPDGFVHFLYYDVTPDAFCLKHAYDSENGWVIETIDPYLYNVFGTGGANIVFDDSGRVHVGYYDWGQVLCYAWKVNGIWNIEIADPPELTGTYVGPYAALTLDPQGVPHMSYLERNNVDLKHAYKVEYRPGVPTSPSGISRGKPGETYTFATTSKDFDNDKIRYGWDWDGDFEADEWSPLINSGENCEMTHKWEGEGTYNIRVTAVDEKDNPNAYHLTEHGDLSFWSDSLEVKISKSKEIRTKNSDGKTLYFGGSGPGDYSSIQEAIDDANPGDTIFVKAGIYKEHLTISKTDITLQGESKYNTILDGCKTEGQGITIEAEKVTIKDFTIKDFKDHQKDEIYSWDQAGIEIYLPNSTITNNRFIDNGIGIELFAGAHNTTITDNEMLNNGILIGNYFDKTSYPDITPESFLHDISNNTLNGRPLCYYKDKKDFTVPKDAGQITMVNCTNFTIENMYMSNNDFPIIMAYCYNSLIENITVTDAEGEILLFACENNTIQHNTITNTFKAVCLEFESRNNIVRYNDLSNNYVGVSLYTSANNNTVYRNKIYNNSGPFSAGMEIVSYHGGTQRDNNITENQIYNNLIGITFRENSIKNKIYLNDISKNKMGIYLEASSDYNEITSNNFRRNLVQAIFNGCSTNTWDDNYWNRPRILPKPIVGTRGNLGIIPWINFDRNPAREPYAI